MKLNTPQKICLAFFISLSIYWIGLFMYGSKTGFYNYLWGFILGLMPLIGGLVAMTRIQAWGGFKNAVGKAVFFIGLGVFCWGLGEMIWSYYNFFLNIPVPYPSLADIGFAPSIFFYGLGAVYLAKATGVTLALKNKWAKLFTIIAPLVVLFISYYVLVIIARGGVLVSSDGTLIKTILDILYPLGDFISLALAVVLSGLAFRYLKGAYKFDIISILLGLGIMFVVDSIFSYTTTINTYYNGSATDLLFTIGMFLLTFGVLGFHSPLKRGGASSDINIYDDRVVFVSTADDFAVVVENEELADALKKVFQESKREQKCADSKVKTYYWRHRNYSTAKAI